MPFITFSVVVDVDYDLADNEYEALRTEVGNQAQEFVNAWEPADRQPERMPLWTRNEPAHMR